jgi:heat shock protein HtpX
MDFWKAQSKARFTTQVYIALFVLLTVVASFFAEMGARGFAGEAYVEESGTSFPTVGVLFALVTFSVAIFQYLQFKGQGGAYVAESLGGRLVDPNTADFKERQLINIVQEMATAAAVPVPPVYIIPSQQINAFAAGLKKDDAAVAVTLGTLHLLNREELQGVVAHEFGHIHNGDMLINMRLAAMIMGFFFVLTLGLRLMQFSRFQSESRERGNPMMLLALIFLVAGSLTWIFGSILRASVSRQREYLADASAVQFTRNADGIANALRKIARQGVSDMPPSGNAYAHMYFDNYVGFSSLFATHPPIEKRISALESLNP